MMWRQQRVQQGLVERAYREVRLEPPECMQSSLWLAASGLRPSGRNVMSENQTSELTKHGIEAFAVLLINLGSYT